MSPESKYRYRLQSSICPNNRERSTGLINQYSGLRKKSE
ncbi:hypothetical protein CEXT_741801, partial [Caerostris extrusa]